MAAIKTTVLRVEAEDSLVGSLMRQLDSMDGVITVDIEPYKQKAGSRPRGPYKTSGKGNQPPSFPKGELTNAVLRVLAKGKQTPPEVRKQIQAIGAGKSSLHSTLQRLTEQKDITGNTQSGYTLTAQGRKRLAELEPPKE